MENTEADVTMILLGELCQSLQLRIVAPGRDAVKSVAPDFGRTSTACAKAVPPGHPSRGAACPPALPHPSIPSLLRSPFTRSASYRSTW